MKTLALTLGLALASLYGANVYAQAAGPGQDRASPSAPTTATQRAAAKETRKVEGKAVAKTHAGVADDQPATASKGKVSEAEKQAGKAQRKAAGAAAVKAPKDKSGPNS